MSHSLKHLQNWFQTVITHPDGVRVGIASVNATDSGDRLPRDVERIVLPSQQLTSIERLQIYGSAYYGRLIDCLKAQFPAVCQAVGETHFEGMAYGYLVRHPSTSYTLAALGRSFNEFLKDVRPPRDHSNNEPDFADFVIDLARLEQTYSEVFDGPGPESAKLLRPEEFAGLSPETFANSRFVMFESVRLLTLQFPAHEYVSALRRALEPTVPVARPTYLVITRRDYIVRRFEVTEAQHRLLTAIQQNQTIGQALMTLLAQPDVDGETLQESLQRWFEEWAAAPLFSQFIRWAFR